MALDDADKKVFADMLKEALAGLPSTVKGAVDTAVTPLNAKIADLEKKLVEAQAGAGAGDGKGAGAGAGAGDGKGAGAAGAEDKRLAELTKRMETMQQERADERRRAQILERDNQVRNELVKAGLTPEAAELGLSFLDRSGQYIEKDGVFAVRGKDKFGTDVELPIADGIKAFLETPSGKHLLPPVNTQGSGDGRNRAGAGAGGAVRDEKELLGILSGMGLIPPPVSPT